MHFMFSSYHIINFLSYCPFCTNRCVCVCGTVLIIFTIIIILFRWILTQILSICTVVISFLSFFLCVCERERDSAIYVYQKRVAPLPIHLSLSLLCMLLLFFSLLSSSFPLSTSLFSCFYGVPGMYTYIYIYILKYILNFFATPSLLQNQKKKGEEVGRCNGGGWGAKRMRVRLGVWKEC